MNWCQLLIVAIGPILAILTGFHHFFLSPVLENLGAFRVIQNKGTRDCVTVPNLASCEDMILHQATGLLYLACSTVEDRIHWTSGDDSQTPEGRDYMALYDHLSGSLTQLEFKDFDVTKSWSLHGIDVVPSAADPTKLFVYVVNHFYTDTPLSPASNSSVEIFETVVGSKTLQHLRSVRSPFIKDPNDVVGSSDGLSFYVTNDDDIMNASRIGTLRRLFAPQGSVAYCHASTGCLLAATGIVNANGIVHAPNGTVYVSSSLGDGIRVYEAQDSHALVQVDHLQTKSIVDNINMDANGVIWGAEILNGLHFKKAMQDLTYSTRTPSGVLAVSQNTGPGSFFGENYKLERVLEDDGNFVSTITNVIHDAQRGFLYLHGITMKHLTVCKV